MNSMDFVVEELNRFIKEFPHAKVRYEFDDKALVHVIEILPKEMYHQDNNYIEWENGLFDRFIEAYPMENICFISSDALVGIENPVYDKTGPAFEGVSYSVMSGDNVLVCPMK